MLLKITTTTTTKHDFITQITTKSHKHGHERVVKRFPKNVVCPILAFRVDQVYHQNDNQ